MNQKLIAKWATEVLRKSWLYKTPVGELVLPVDVKDDWCFVDTSTDEALTPRLLYTTKKKVIYRVSYSSGTVDVSVPMSSITVVEC